MIIISLDIITWKKLYYYYKTPNNRNICVYSKLFIYLELKICLNKILKFK